MTERPSPGDWERWQKEWRRFGTADGLALGAMGQIARARRGTLLARLIEGAIAAAALLITAAALQHAGNPFEAGLGLVVGLCIGGLWVQRILLRRGEDGAASGSSPQHLTALRGLRLKEVRLARFIQVVLALELIFLTPWWVNGTRIHHRTLVDIGSWLTVWLPLAGMIALVVWSVRLGQRAQAEVTALDRLREQYGEEPR
jgi:hypothetical protein